MGSYFSKHNLITSFPLCFSFLFINIWRKNLLPQLKHEAVYLALHTSTAQLSKLQNSSHFTWWLTKCLSIFQQNYVLFCTIICIIFTSLCKNLVKLTWVLAEAFRCHVHHFQCLTVLVELAAMFQFVVVGLAEMLLWLLCMIVSKSVWDL